MARLFGLMGNRADLAGRVLLAERGALKARAKAENGVLGWGVGFYQGGEVLIRRRPIDDKSEIDVAQIAADLRADLVVGHVRNATVGSRRTENAHPFRYRQWLFAMTGTLTAFDAIRDRLVESVPSFLRGGIRGDTDAEVLFHVYLSFLHDAGRLNDVVTPAPVAADALRAAVAVADAMAAEVGGERSRVNAMVASGEYVVARTSGETMATRVFSGRQDADALIGDDHALRRRAPELARMHFALVASDFDSPLDARWNAVPDRAIVTVARGEDPVVELA